jgi:basic amino acid/polyamine antiporter, APA family
LYRNYPAEYKYRLLTFEFKRSRLAQSLKRTLTARDLTVFGIAAIIGGGIFSTIGKASYSGGPGVVFLFIFIAVACSFTALAYAEFAALVPKSGSAYSYAFHAFGRAAGWMVGWALIMEYAIGNITYAISWSDYFTSLINDTTRFHIPEWMSMDYFTARAAFAHVDGLLTRGATVAELSSNAAEAGFVPGYLAWLHAPRIGSFHLVVDIPAVAIVILVTMVVFRGIRGSRNATNIMVFIKITAVLLVLVMGAVYINPANWHPFTPNGLGGILSGTSAVFFAYIGFDAISTTSEECVNPQKDIPKAIVFCLIFCTIIYILMALVLTGVVSYKELNLGDPLSYIFTRIPGMHWLAGVIAVSGVVAIASVLLIYQVGQPRIWLAMSRDGLMPKRFATIHPRFFTPSFATIVTGVMVAVPALFLDMNFVTDISSMGTLFSFVFVCAGIMLLHARRRGMPPAKGFRIPYINARYITAPLFVLVLALYIVYLPETFVFTKGAVAEKIPMLIFFLVFLVVAVLSALKNLSLIPVLGLVSCAYMMAQLGWKSWLWFTVWMMAGWVIYFYRKRGRS